MKNILLILCLFAFCNICVLAQRDSETEEVKLPEVSGNSERTSSVQIKKSKLKTKFPRFRKLPSTNFGNDFSDKETKKQNDDKRKKFELFGGISFQRIDTEQFSEFSQFGGLSQAQIRTNFNANDSQLNQGFDGAFGAAKNSVGFNIAGTYYFRKKLGITADFAYHKKEETRNNTSNPIFFEDFATSKRSQFSFLVGPQLKFRRSKKVQPFVRVMGGFVRQKNQTGLFFNNGGNTNPGGSNAPVETLRLIDNTTNFALAFGGGIDIKINKRFAIRVIQADYIMNFMQGRNASLSAPTIGGANGANLGATAFDSSLRNSLRFSFGVVFRK